MKKVLINYNMFHEGFSELIDKYTVTFIEGNYLNFKELLKIIPKYDSFSCIYNFPVTKEFIEQSVNLKIIANFASGYDNIDVDYAFTKGLIIRVY